MKRPPYPIGAGSLFVAFNAVAELTCHLSLGWEMPQRVMDLLVEFRWLTNGTSWREGQKSKHKLIHAAEYFGLDVMAAVEKSEMQQLAIRGGPFTEREQAALHDYCEQDVKVTAELLQKMCPHIQILQSIQRGRFIRSVAQTAHNGIPIDSASYRLLQERREDVIIELANQVNPRFDVYSGTVFKHDRMEALVARHNFPWPRKPSGVLCQESSTWKDMVAKCPFLQDLHDCRRTISQLRNNDLAIGPDGRNRGTNFPFSTLTSRNTWKSAEFIFGQPSWMRGLIQPPKDRAIAYLDYTSQENAIAAALSGDTAMADAYATGDVYLAFGKQAKILPPEATKQTHPAERKRLKACVLGLQYLISEFGLANQLGIQTDYAVELIAAHKRTYPRFWQWVDGIIDHAIINGWQESSFGWKVRIRHGQFSGTQDSRERLNIRSIANFPVQSNAAEICRLACNLVSEAGITLLASVHDALLVEGPVVEIQRIADETERLMVKAGKDVLNGFEIRVDGKIVRHPDRLLSEDHEHRMWEFVRSRLGLAQDEGVAGCYTEGVAQVHTSCSAPVTPAHSY
jgi:hypothetical protein